MFIVSVEYETENSTSFRTPENNFLETRAHSMKAYCENNPL